MLKRLVASSSIAIGLYLYFGHPLPAILAIAFLVIVDTIGIIAGIKY